MVHGYPFPVASFSAASVLVPDYIEPVGAGALASLADDLGLPSIFVDTNPSETFCRFNVQPTRPLIFGSHIRSDNVNTNVTTLLFDSAAGNTLISFQQRPDGLINIYRGTSGAGTLLATTPVATFESIWSFWEFAVNVDDVAGSLHVWRNGQLAVAQTGINTQEFDEDIERIVMRQIVDVRWRFADGYVNNASGPTAALGPVRVIDMRPNVDETSQDWTPSTGTDGFAMVDEDRASQSTGDDDYIDSLNEADRSQFSLTDLPAEVQDVHFVTAYGVARKPVGGADTLVVGIESNAQEDASPGLPFGDPAYTALIQTFATDPDGDVAWTPAAANALQMFIEHTGVV